MANTKPYVAAACICEKVLMEPDNVNSIIRIVDTFAIPPLPELPPGLPAEVRPTIRLLVYVSLKSGDVTGSHDVGVVLRRPDGTKEGPQEWPVVLTGGPESGANLQLDFALTGPPGKPPSPGLYWFDVMWDDEELTSIPFRLKQEEAATTAPTGTP